MFALIICLFIFWGGDCTFGVGPEVSVALGQMPSLDGARAQFKCRL